MDTLIHKNTSPAGLPSDVHNGTLPVGRGFDPPAHYIVRGFVTRVSNRKEFSLVLRGFPTVRPKRQLDQFAIEYVLC